jgi:hypothetical protein
LGFANFFKYCTKKCTKTTWPQVRFVERTSFQTMFGGNLG